VWIARAHRKGGIDGEETGEKRGDNGEKRCKESGKQALTPNRIDRHDRPRQAARGDPRGTRRSPA
jgi:hypothetical protein